MFVGAVPKEFISQILDAVPFGDWGAVHVEHREPYESKRFTYGSGSARR
jgi:hypothetical protein